MKLIRLIEQSLDCPVLYVPSTSWFQYALAQVPEYLSSIEAGIAPNNTRERMGEDCKHVELMKLPGPDGRVDLSKDPCHSNVACRKHSTQMSPVGYIVLLTYSERYVIVSWKNINHKNRNIHTA